MLYTQNEVRNRKLPPCVYNLILLDPNNIDYGTESEYQHNIQ